MRKSTALKIVGGVSLASLALLNINSYHEANDEWNSRRDDRDYGRRVQPLGEFMSESKTLATKALTLLSYPGYALGRHGYLASTQHSYLRKTSGIHL